MLTYLGINNIAIIDRIQVDIPKGFVVITGETGSGKSMLLQAVGLLMGGKVSRDLLRSGESELSVEGTWCLSGVEAGRLRGILGLDDDDELPEELAIRRVVKFSEGAKRDKIFVNGQLSSISVLTDLSEELLNLSTQHESIRLLRREFHAGLLDGYGQLSEYVNEVAQLWRLVRGLEARISAVRERAERRSEREAELIALKAEIEGLGTRPGEEDEIEQEISKLSHASEIGLSIESALSLLYDDEGDVLTRLSQVEKALGQSVRYDEGLRKLQGRVEVSRLDLADLVQELRHLASGVESDPLRLDFLQSRIAQLQKALRRHGVADSRGLVELLKSTEAEYNLLLDEGSSLNRLEEELKEKKAELLRIAGQLSVRRKKAALEMQAKVQAILVMLEMKKAVFEVGVVWNGEAIGESGGDTVEFLMSANPGEPARALGKIASGGELSRVLLALKVVLADVYSVPTYIFDEIDSGIGGKTSLSIGNLLRDLSSKHQVICITHTAQLAAFASDHIKVEKRNEGNKTFAGVRVLEGTEERVEELARMLSGLEDSVTALAHARELLMHGRSLPE